MTTPLDESWWHGRLTRTSPPSTDLHVLAVLGDPVQTGAQPFPVALNNGEKYWVKAMGNGQGDIALVNEAVSCGLAQILGASMRPGMLVSLPQRFDGMRLSMSGHRARAGLAHASKHLESGEEGEWFQFRQHDNNRVREVGIYALWDLCLGQDEQWLYELNSDYSIWSHDHSMWFALQSEEWDQDMCRRLVDTPWTVDETQYPVTALSASTFHDFAQRLRDLSVDQILDVLSRVPPEWGKTNRDLEVLGWMIYRRSKAVAQRLINFASRAS